MAIDLSDDILQDFLVEAGEIIETLGGQLIDLEKNPEDYDVLNSIFRGFHTVKGGAGFLGITQLVEICHRAEDVFNLLRQGDRTADPDIMDVILKVHDTLVRMFEEINEGNDPEDPDQDIIRSLDLYIKGEVPVQTQDDTSGHGSDTEEEISEEIVLQEKTPDEATAPETTESNLHNGTGYEEITEDEFETLLDDLHGKGIPGENVEDEDNSETPATVENQDEQAAVATDDEDITDDEFEDLLDQLHGNAVPGEASSGNATQVVAEDKSDDKGIKGNVTDVPSVVSSGSMPVRQGVSEAAKEEKPKPAAKKDQLQGETTVRVDTKRLDDIMNLVGELVLVRNRLLTMQHVMADENMSIVASNLDLVTSDLQTAVMKTRMQPIKKVFGRFPRVVRDLARSLEKEVNLELVGEETDLDKNLVEALADPLVHLVRNAVDHGVEMPDIREAAGKPRMGTVVLSAEQEGDHILLRIRDDGAGMDAGKIKSIAIDKGVIDKDSSERMSDKEAFNLIFMPGFSTKEEISDISGRGVGMDVVKTKITQLNGSLEIDSVPGVGSVIDIKVPLTLAIMPTLMVMLQEQIFALPLGSVVEIFDLDEECVRVVDGQPVIIIRDKPLPVYRIGSWLLRGRAEESRGNHIVMVNSGGRNIGFIVDKLLGQEEVVIKPLGAMLNGTAGIAGATITGNGKISLILDIPALVGRYARKVA